MVIMYRSMRKRIVKCSSSLLCIRLCELVGFYDQEVFDFYMLLPGTVLSSSSSKCPENHVVCGFCSFVSAVWLSNP